MRRPKPKQIDRYQIRFDEEAFIDLFSGGGGTSTGIEKAIGRPVFAAVNHDPDAIAMHMTNHPYTKHYQTSVWDVDPMTACEGRKVALLRKSERPEYDEDRAYEERREAELFGEDG